MALPIDQSIVVAVFNIVVIDLVLSGDNAVVIAMAVKNLPADIRGKASVIGASCAVVLRILLTGFAAELLHVPLLQSIGGMVLFWIAYKLLIEEEEGEETPGEIRDFWEAVRIVVLADLVMSLDNILAVGGASEGKLWLMLFGLGISIPLVLFGSSILARLLDRLPALAYVGSGILAWTAGRMVVHDSTINGLLVPLGIYKMDMVLPIVATAVVVVAGYLASKRKAAEVGALRPPANERESSVDAVVQPETVQENGR